MEIFLVLYAIDLIKANQNETNVISLCSQNSSNEIVCIKLNEQNSIEIQFKPKPWIMWH